MLSFQPKASPFLGRERSLRKAAPASPDVSIERRQFTSNQGRGFDLEAKTRAHKKPKNEFGSLETDVDSARVTPRNGFSTSGNGRALFRRPIRSVRIVCARRTRHRPQVLQDRLRPQAEGRRTGSRKRCRYYDRCKSDASPARSSRVAPHARRFAQSLRPFRQSVLWLQPYSPRSQESHEVSAIT
jgi:hypothetical protein